MRGFPHRSCLGSRTFRVEVVLRMLLPLVGLATLLLPGGALAQTGTTARFVYTRGIGAEQCPDEVAVRDGVAKRVGYEPFHPAARTTVAAAITRTSRGLRAQVDIGDDGGHVT